MPKVSVIIPVWNLWNMTAACLRSLAEHNAGAACLEVLVVDNGSDDATGEQLPVLGRELFGGNFKGLRLPRNMGFAVACNAGARKAGGDLLLFLNNDTILSPDWLPPLIASMEKPGTGATGPLLLYPAGPSDPDGGIQHCGIAVSPFRRLWHIYEHFPAGHPLPRKSRPLQAITGAALMTRRPLFFEVGAFFEEYSNGFEDIDFCCALRERGFKLTLTPQSVVTHYTSSTAGRFDADKRNAELFSRRRRGQIKPDLHLLAAADGYRLRLGVNLNCWLEPTPEREQTLADTADSRIKAGARAETVLSDALTEEPLWLNGRLRLIDLLEAGGRRREALSAALAAFDFFPLPQMHIRIARLGRQEGITEDLAPVLERLAEASESRPEDFRPLVQTVRREAYRDSDMILAGIVNDWLTRYAAGPGNPYGGLRLK
ncbi:MAG: glycosyltransferase family 2 protein [Desulfovibrio sp.]|jgi:GT2 family glycosyltransferase|nr:glycosyltransferase family 2 protein [Desulfovibrio sp.]